MRRDFGKVKRRQSGGKRNELVFTDAPEPIRCHACTRVITPGHTLHVSGESVACSQEHLTLAIDSSGRAS